MSKKRKNNTKKEQSEIIENNRQIYYSKETYLKYAKRYVISLCIVTPIILIICYLFSLYIPGYTTVVNIFVALALLLLSLFICLIIFTKKDEKDRLNSTKEKQRDPFSD